MLTQERIGDVVEHERYADLVGLRGALYVFPVGEEDHVQSVVAQVDDGDVFPEVVRVVLDVAKEYARALRDDPDVSADPAGVSLYPYVRRPYGVDDLPVIALRVHSGRNAQYNVAVWEVVEREAMTQDCKPGVRRHETGSRVSYQPPSLSASFPTRYLRPLTTTGVMSSNAPSLVIMATAVGNICLSFSDRHVLVYP